MVAGITTLQNNLKASYDNSKAIVTATYNKGTAITKFAAHEFLRSTAKVIDQGNKALDSTTWVVAGSVILDTFLNGKFSEANTGHQGTATYRVLQAAGVRSHITDDPALLQSLQIPAALIFALAGLPAAQSTLGWLKDKVVKLDRAIPA